MEPSIIQGGTFKDERGVLSYVNEFDLHNIKRFYNIMNAADRPVRAWQGHRIEHKYFYATAGSFVIAWVKIDDWDNPSLQLKADHVFLNASAPRILSLPPGYANGIKSLGSQASLLVFSDLTLEDSGNDRWSFDSNYWFNWEQF